MWLVSGWWVYVVACDRSASLVVAATSSSQVIDHDIAGMDGFTARGAFGVAEFGSGCGVVAGVGVGVDVARRRVFLGG
ncbi:hypothetical protein NJB18091_09700 [Mycobacterium marinum]|uniref:Secreted protein n=1 Tax=Mycobacterium ulcerans TaxID=1809 RepID=A0ABY5TTM8_MYCUL|nr:hypothetical protein [Mycobacterium ulcerans]UVY89984.1 hypothetical protein MJO63_25750 [Mycobacterium ulcerans]GJP28221.1 hypothetical protein NJB18091_09700 [Mycobacterium marinum]